MAETVAICSLIRNEANKFLRPILNRWSSISDILILLDDNSDDGSYEIMQEHDGEKQVIRRASSEAAWGNEAEARKELWHHAQKSNCDWLFFLDADMIPAADPRKFFLSGLDGVSFWLYDLWTATQYRYDGYWQGHTWPRVWAVRNPKFGFKADWVERGVHCGHLPGNLPISTVISPPPPHGAILHYAYSTPELRAAKYAQYNSIRDQLSSTEKAHVDSILDPQPFIRSLEFTPELTL